jgi:HSP20 family protein
MAMLTTLTRRLGNGSNWLTPLDVARREFENWMGNWWDQGTRDLVGAYPVDIHEDENFIYVDAEMPGFTRDQIEVTLEKGVLTIQAERKTEEKKGEPHIQERRFTKVARSFTLPNTVDENKVEAKVTDGVLHLKLSKREEVKPRKIEVK